MRKTFRNAAVSLCNSLLRSFAGFALATAFLAAPVSAEPIKIGGSGGQQAAMELLTEAFRKAHPEVDFVIVKGLGTRGGLRALGDGVIQIALAARLLNEDESALGLVAVEYARTPLVFATSTASSGTRLSTRELIDIYEGRSTAWPDGTRLRLILRPPADSDTLVVRAISDAVAKANSAAHARPGMLIALTDADSADQIEKTPGSLGTTTLAQIAAEKRQVKLLMWDGAAPTVENLAAGRYPLYKRFFLVTGPKTSAQGQQFVAFVQSSQGQAILRRTQHWVSNFQSIERRPAISR